MFEPIGRKSLSDSVFEQIRDQIVSGQVPVGKPLPSERKLCEMLNVNRGALREALKRLEQAGLVSIQHGGGTNVLDYRHTAGLELLPVLLVQRGEIVPEVARSVMEMRAALAPEIARLCAQRRDEETLVALEQTVASMESIPLQDPDSAETLEELGMEFWNLLTRGSENIAYQLALNSLHGTYQRLREVLRDILSVERENLSGYRAILDAIRDQEPNIAEAAAKTFVHKGTKAIQEVLSFLDSPISDEGR